MNRNKIGISILVLATLLVGMVLIPAKDWGLSKPPFYRVLA